MARLKREEGPIRRGNARRLKHWRHSARERWRQQRQPANATSSGLALAGGRGLRSRNRAESSPLWNRIWNRTQWCRQGPRAPAPRHAPCLGGRGARLSGAHGRRSATAVRANVTETSSSAPAGRTGAVVSIGRARDTIIGTSDCDREHLIPDPRPPTASLALPSLIPPIDIRIKRTARSW
jgi:hypothetical protein